MPAASLLEIGGRSAAGAAEASLVASPRSALTELCSPEPSCPVLCWDATSALMLEPSEPAVAVPAGTMAPTTTSARIVRVLIEVYISPPSRSPVSWWGDRAGGLNRPMIRSTSTVCARPHLDHGLLHGPDVHSYIDPSGARPAA